MITLTFVKFGYFGNMQREFTHQIGTSLMEYAAETATSARGFVTELFPYIFVAAKRMSTRAISAYLLDQYQVKISAASVAKALREPDRHVESLLETIDPAARLISEAHDAEEEDFLKSEKVFEAIVNTTLPALDSGDQDEVLQSMSEYQDAVEVIRQWHQYDARFKSFALSFLHRRSKGEE